MMHVMIKQMSCHDKTLDVRVDITVVIMKGIHQQWDTNKHGEEAIQYMS